jgi:23S rRNA (cytosine1962-C5)-methyltransferase
VAQVRVITLRPGRESSVGRRHPWLFSGAIAATGGDDADGRVEVRDASGALLASGFHGGSANLAARLWTFGSEALDEKLIRYRFERALALRREVIGLETTGYRLLHAEGDETPGLIADRYGDTDVLVFTASGLAAAREEIVPLYRDVFAPSRLVVDDGSGTAPFREYGLRFTANLGDGQKTGFFLDQRENRRRVRAMAGGCRVLNLFSYSGAFSVAALAGGAVRAVDVDTSASALATARDMRRDNGFAADDADFVRADVFTDVRERVAAGEQWDLVICDPPAFAKKRADVDRAARGYKDVLRLSMALVRPGGTLLACSCSGLVSADLYQKIVFSAALDSGTSYQILARTGAGPDHPVSVYCPESEYLKAFFLRRG